MSGLEKFLKQQEIGGFDSQGEFTISAGKALQKLGDSQLPKPSFWVLKVVQAAVAAQASKLKFRTSPSLTRVEILLKRPLSADEVRKALTSVDCGDSAARQLGIGLRAVAAGNGGQFVLALASDSGHDYLIWDGRTLSVRRNSEPVTKPKLELEVALVSQGQWPRWTNAFKSGRTSDEKLILGNLAHTCPVRIQVDGEPLPRSDEDDPACFIQPLFCGFDPIEQGGIRMPLWLLASLPRSTVNSGQFVDMYWRVGYCYRLVHRAFQKGPTPVSKAAYSVVNWLHDGVIVEKQILRDQSAPFMVSLFVDAAACKADISGFRLRRDEEYQRRLDEVRLRHLKAILEVENRVEPLAHLPGDRPNESMASTFGFMPLKGSLNYESPGPIANRLVRTPQFRTLLKETVLNEARRCAGSR